MKENIGSEKMIGISIANSTEWESTLEHFRKTHDECLISPW